MVVKTLGMFGSEAREFLHELGSRMTRISLEHKSFHYLIQKISIAVQRGNASAVLETVAKESDLGVLFLCE